MSQGACCANRLRPSHKKKARWAIISIGGSRNGRGKSVTKDFVDGLPRSRKENTSMWVIVGRLTKSAHFTPVKSERTAS